MVCGLFRYTVLLHTGLKPPFYTVNVVCVPHNSIHIIVLMLGAVSIAGCLLQSVEATVAPNFTSMSLLVHFRCLLWLGAFFAQCREPTLEAFVAILVQVSLFAPRRE